MHPLERQLRTDLAACYCIVEPLTWPVSWGVDIPQALAYLWTLQRACDIQVGGAALGPTVAVSGAVQRKSSADALQFDARHGAGRDVFDALVRQVDRRDRSYRDLD